MTDLSGKVGRITGGWGGGAGAGWGEGRRGLGGWGGEQGRRFHGRRRTGGVGGVVYSFLHNTPIAKLQRYKN